MFQFLNPIWLFAAAALVIPVLIHLWNIRPGKVLKVGSISLIDPASRKSSRSFKLLDIPLFILRCLLLLTLALLLSLPVWQKKLKPVKLKGWVMIPKEHFINTYKKFKPHIDSLTKAGYEFHYFNQGFSKSNLTQILLHPKDSIRIQDTTKQQINYWTLIKQLDNKVASTLPLYVFTPNQANYFIGTKPQVALNLHWQTYIPTDSVSNWVERAWFTNNNSIRVVQGNSTATGTAYSYATVQGNQANSVYTINTQDGRPTIKLNSSKQTAIPIDTTTTRLAIYTDNALADASYLKAALQALTELAQHKTVLKQYSSPALIRVGQSWLFWLSEKPVPKRLLQQCQHILVYAKGKVVDTNSWIDNDGLYATAVQQQQKIELFKLISSSNNEEVIWRDGFGHSVLGLHSGTNKVYRFYSRFNPSWNDLVWSNEFPTWLLKLMTPAETTANNSFDKRALSQDQLMPELTGDTHMPTVKLTGFTDLQPYFWLALVLLFLAERWLSNREPKTTTSHD
ncbi:BatA domain-containing protein [Mucilaginibacter lacusdianchii]|uniref:BatA domain-containing protein n=1 Tax=Mucilaginibacter lacusdianchii TaxID=2684211 RepID=UPI00131BE08B|nr:BatA domain-containing protein [Mucilaginibacter sp. JXJ CY 39]